MVPSLPVLDFFNTLRLGNLRDKFCDKKSGVGQMAKQTVYEMIPQLGKLRDEVLFGDVWEQPELSKRDRSLVTCSVLSAFIANQ